MKADEDLKPNERDIERAQKAQALLLAKHPKYLRLIDDALLRAKAAAYDRMMNPVRPRESRGLADIIWPRRRYVDAHGRSSLPLVRRVLRGACGDTGASEWEG